MRHVANELAADLVTVRLNMIVSYWLSLVDYRSFGNNQLDGTIPSQVGRLTVSEGL